MDLQQIASIVLVAGVVLFLWLKIKRKGGGCCGGSGSPAATGTK